MKLVLLMVILPLLAACGGRGDSGRKKVGFAQESNAHPFRIAETESLKEHAEKNDYDLIFTDGENDLAKQVANMENLIAQQVDYIVLAPREEEGFEEVFANAKEAGIPVILIDRKASGTPGEDYTTVITSDFVWEGEQAAKWLLDNNEGTINVVELAGTPGASVAKDRQRGFMDIATESGRINIIASQVGDFYRAAGQTVMANIIQSKGGEIDAVFAHNDEMALGAVAAIKEAGLEGIQIIGIDGQKEAAKAVKNGDMSVTITCDPHFGEIVFKIIKDLEEGKRIEPEQFISDTLYDITNIDQYTNPF